jgi:pimeloyl-CoA dehydrogenase small subunit
MDFELSNEQQLLKDSVDRLIADRYELRTRGKILESDAGWSREIWSTLADLGLLGLPFSNEDGGFGGGPVEQMIIQEAFGRGLLVEPYLATVILGGSAIALAASAERRAEILGGVAEGQRLLAFAHGERLSRYRLRQVETTARRVGGDGWVLDGEKTTVIHGGPADTLIVSARTSGGKDDEGGISLFVVPANTAGVTVRAYPTFDGMRGADITFASVALASDALLGEADEAYPVIEHVEQHGIAAVAAESVGLMQAALDMSVEYLKTRTQFGRPIGEFQVLQHRAADMYVAVEEARSIAIHAAMMVGEADPVARRQAMAMAKAQIGVSAREVGQSGVQLHGGIGITEEYAIGHYFKRLSMIERQFGDVEHHMALLASLETPG